MQVCVFTMRTLMLCHKQRIDAGLLEGAHAGRGLGHEFLRHCQRARMLVHIIDGSGPDPVGDFNAIQTELELFAEDLASKPQVNHRHAPCDACGMEALSQAASMHLIIASADAQDLEATVPAASMHLIIDA